MPDLSNYFLISDLDGTLLPDNKILLQKDKDAIARFMSDGGMFAIATGRTLQACMRFIEELKVKVPAIMYNGSLIYDIIEKKPLYTCELPEGSDKIAGEILEKFKNTGCEILRLDNIYVVCNNEYERHHVEVCQVEPVYTTIAEVTKTNWHKILFADAPDRLDEMTEYVKDKNYPVDFVRSDKTFFEILPKNSSKGAALKEYINIMSLRGKKIISAGDYNNDIELLEAADIGAAPFNAQPGVKAIADIVLTKTSNEGAIAELIDMIYEGKL